MAGAPTTYSELKAALLDALTIDNTSPYADDVDRFIDLAEQRFNAKLQHRRQMTSTTLTMDANGEASLPPDYVAFARATGIEGARRVPLIECSPEWMTDEYPTTVGGIGRHIAIDGGTVRVRPVTSSVDLHYYQEIPPLTNAAPTNWLLTGYPGLYLAAALYEAALWYDDPEGAARYTAQLNDQLDQLHERDRRERMVMRQLNRRGPTP